MPFSLGKRACIGQNLAIMELRVILANVVRFFNFEALRDVELELFVTLKPKDLLMTFTAR